MGIVKRAEDLIDNVTADMMQSYTGPSATPAGNPSRIAAVQLIVKLAIIALILNVPGRILWRLTEQEWPFVVWFLANMFLWAGPTVHRLLTKPSSPLNDQKQNKGS